VAVSLPVRTFRDGNGNKQNSKIIMRTYSAASISGQVDKMRTDIGRCGESRVGCEELNLLCPEGVSEGEKLVGVAQIAEWERWTFVYCTDGSVLFTPLQAKTGSVS
jgi:hypothetical protein